MITLSTANSLRFYKPDNGLISTGNTPINTVYSGMFGYCFAHKFIATDEIPVLVTTTGEVPVVTFNFDDGQILTIPEFYKETVGSYDYYYYKYATKRNGYFSINNGLYKSERVEIVNTKPGIEILWYNFDDAFGFHYIYEIVNIMRVNGMLKDFAVAGESTIFDNKQEQIKLKETLWRQCTLITEPLPAEVIEKIAIAAAHDMFVVNGVEYITDSLPTQKQMGMSNLYELELKLKERNALGRNRLIKGYIDVVNYKYIDKDNNYYTDNLGNNYTT